MTEEYLTEEYLCHEKLLSKLEHDGLVYGKEMSTEGDWYAVKLEDLIKAGYTDLEIHCVIPETRIINDIHLLKESEL